MKGWLQKIMTPPARTGAQAGRSGQMPAQTQSGQVPAPPLKKPAPAPAQLPNATVIYGIGASFLFVASLSLLLAGRWFSALTVFALGLCLVGFAVHLMKHQD